MPNWQVDKEFWTVIVIDKKVSMVAVKVKSIGAVLNRSIL